MADDYSKMAMYNPYIQMALGILAGNTGRSKSEAFANAMGGGLSAAQSAQQMARQQQMDVLAQKKAQREQEAYDQALAEQQAVQQWAQDMMKKDPANAEYYGLMMQNPSFGVQWFKTRKDAENDAARTAAYLAKGGGGGSGGAFNWTPRDMSEGDFKNIDAQMSLQHGDAWDELDAQQKRAIAMQAYQQSFYDAKRGVAPGSPSPITLPEPRPGEFEKTIKKLGDKTIDLWNYFRGTATEPSAPAGGDVVTDSSGRKWKYKGSGDRNDQKNYREVK